jgi:hypothetical protein
MFQDGGYFTADQQLTILAIEMWANLSTVDEHLRTYHTRDDWRRSHLPEPKTPAPGAPPKFDRQVYRLGHAVEPDRHGTATVAESPSQDRLLALGHVRGELGVDDLVVCQALLDAGVVPGRV